ncbi:Nitroreductase family protein [uncultured archaeon]|nr:Nitroreductase family protein [uncultured archaeon]
MALTIKFTVAITLFLLLGVALAGIFMQPHVSTDGWNLKESDFPANASTPEKMKFLLGYAVLAPSIYNSQPWKFNISENEILILADKTRWLQVADAAKREQYLSLGAALENLVLAAEHFGYSCDITYLPGPEDAIARAILKPEGSIEPSQNTSLFEAIVSRSTCRQIYEERSPSPEDLQNLMSQSGVREGHIFLISDQDLRKRFLNLTVQADQIQYSDANYKSELGHWLGQGVMGPTGLQALIAQITVVLLNYGPQQMHGDAMLVNSTPVIGFICTDGNDRESQIEAGRLLERFWLAATVSGLCLHPMSQTLEVAETKAKMAEILPPGSGHLQQSFLLGYPRTIEEHTPRRAVDDVLVSVPMVKE